MKRYKYERGLFAEHPKGAWVRYPDAEAERAAHAETRAELESAKTVAALNHMAYCSARDSWAVERAETERVNAAEAALAKANELSKELAHTLEAVLTQADRMREAKGLPYAAQAGLYEALIEHIRALVTQRGEGG